MKIKDLPKDTNLVGMKLIASNKFKLKNKKMFIAGGWNKGFWLKDKMTDERIYPIFFKNFKEIEDWEVTK